MSKKERHQEIKNIIRATIDGRMYLKIEDIFATTQFKEMVEELNSSSLVKDLEDSHDDEGGIKVKKPEPAF